jgi:RecJ-like exonuclease
MMTRKKLIDKSYDRVDCPHCLGKGKCEYSHWVDDLMVDGGQREVIELLECHICQGAGKLIGIPAPVAAATDAVVEAIENLDAPASCNDCRLRGSPECYDRCPYYGIRQALDALKQEATDEI